MTSQTREIRNRAGISQNAAAALAGVSPNTWRLYEAAPEAVTLPVREQCDAAVARMRELAS